jgi:hypothetical protein
MEAFAAHSGWAMSIPSLPRTPLSINHRKVTKMKNLVNALLLTALVVLLIPVTGLAQTIYLQDFEGLAPVDGSLAGDGWFTYTNIFDAGGAWVGGYGNPAPNNVGNYCDITDGQGGGDQEMQQLVMYSNYWDGNHGNLDFVVESNLYQEWTVAPGSGIWFFTFDYKMGDLAGSSEALAFIKVLDPGAGWATTHFLTFDTTSAPTTWSDGELSIDLTGLEGRIVQIGFLTNASNYEPCGVFYDNVAFTANGTVAVETQTWGSVKSLYR